MRQLLLFDILPRENCHQFWLRPNYKVWLALPIVITDYEKERLQRWIASL